ncbi:hypothetical protein [Antarctobacter jejuensis]|uniref:hypothetical protein n=1 Tax=Antarctobacter jejuensis TaxID=1439938 RepID=UPI003FD46C0C
MKLRSVEYVENEGAPKEWRLRRVDLSSRNLIVGQNATGKSRALRVIRAIAEMLCGKRKPTNGSWVLEFLSDSGVVEYKLDVKEGRVAKERLRRKSGRTWVKLIDRGEDGSGRIRLFLGKKRVESKLVDFMTPNGQIAVPSKQDHFQHPFLIPLVDWARGTVYLDHSISTAREFVVHVDQVSGNDSDRQIDMGKTAEVYRQGWENFGKGFDESIIEGMRKLGYSISEVGLEEATVKTSVPIPGVLLGLYVQEDGLNCKTEHLSMSAGMYGALSVIVHVNYWVRSGELKCFIVDDTGDGLDFSRSAALVKMIFEKSDEYNFQCIVASNDRFVMNAVPIDDWTILQRNGHTVDALNSKNSKEIFEDFRLTGLSNFDLLASGFLSNSGY